jgi:hypothetical protein
MAYGHRLVRFPTFLFAQGATMRETIDALPETRTGGHPLAAPVEADVRITATVKPCGT